MHARNALSLLLVALALTACGKVTHVSGPAGTNGTNGIDATPVTVVKLCPGVTTYPSAFVEVAIVISGKLYAVYSANNGFLTELPPGAYSSNAVGSACNFTVNADLTVSN